MRTSQIISLLFAATTTALPIPSSSLSNQAAASSNLFLEIRQPKTAEEKAEKQAGRKGGKKDEDADTKAARKEADAAKREKRKSKKEANAE